MLRRVSPGGFFAKRQLIMAASGLRSDSRIDRDRVRTLQNKKGFCISLDVHRYYNTQQASRSIQRALIVDENASRVPTCRRFVPRWESRFEITNATLSTVAARQAVGTHV